MRIAANSNEDVEAHGIRENTNENVEADERARLAANDNEDAAEDDVEAHGLVANTNEDAVEDQ